MTLADRISASRKTDRRKINIEKWADEDGQVSVYSSSLTAGDLHKLQRKHKDFLNTQTIDGMIDLILMKAENEDGSKAFTLEDKPLLMREDVNVIAEIAAEMFGDISDAEELEKN
jgi:hypothetical protein